MHKCNSDATEIEVLGRTITPQGVKPQKQDVQNFLEKTKFPKTKKALQRYLGFWTTIETISQDCLNALLHSTRC